MIERGTIIHVEKPFAFVLNKKLRKSRCDHCLNSSSEKLLLCQGCKYAFYCSPKCQEESSEVHKSECSNLKKCDRKCSRVDDLVRLMARVIVKLSKGGFKEEKYYTETNRRNFQDLMSHSSDIIQDQKRMQIFDYVCRKLSNFCPGVADNLSVETLLEIYGRSEINSFSLTNVDDEGDVGMGLYLAASVIDHSCDPNVNCFRDGNNLIIVATKDLPKLDWSQLRYRYSDPFLPKQERQQYLLEHYYFQCKCEKCRNPEPLAACSNKECFNYCDPARQKCPKCGAKFPRGFNKDFHDVVKFTERCLEIAQRKEDCELAKYCLERQKRVFHPHNVQHLRTLFLVANLASKDNDTEAALYISQTISGYKAYFGESDPALQGLYLNAGIILLQLNEYKKSYQMLTQAREMFDVVCGKKRSCLKKKELEIILDFLSLTGKL